MKTLGEFYREKVLSLKKRQLEERELPNVGRNLRIEADLFRWKLYYSESKYLSCRSEAEARYLKVFLDAGLTEIMVPKDDSYLESILPELERLKNRIEEIINHYIDGILDSSIRAQVRHKVYAEITK
jgi:hypothetical protein